MADLIERFCVDFKLINNIPIPIVSLVVETNWLIRVGNERKILSAYTYSNNIIRLTKSIKHVFYYLN